MLPHEDPLFFREFARLEEDAIGHTDLADVVHQRAAVDYRQLVIVGDAKQLGDLQRVRGDADRVALGLLVADIKRRNKGFERTRIGLLHGIGHRPDFGVRPLELLVGPFQVEHVVARLVDHLLDGIAAEEERNGESGEPKQSELVIRGGQPHPPLRQAQRSAA